MNDQDCSEMIYKLLNIALLFKIGSKILTLYNLTHLYTNFVLVFVN